jgi:hypothetical protein
LKLERPEVSLKYYASLNDLPQSWNDFLPDGHYLKTEQLAISEHAALPDISHVYIFICRQDKPAAAASFQVLRLQPQHLNEATVKPYQSLLWKSYTRLVRPVLLVAGHLFRHDICSYYWDNSLSDFEAFSYYQKAIEQALCRTCAAAVLVKDVNEQLVTYFQHFAPEYFMLRNDVSMEMDLPGSWSRMTDYEHALRHKYAQRYRKIRQSWQGLSVKELSLEDVRNKKQELFRLYEQVSLKQQVRLGFLSPDYLVMLKEKNDSTLKVWSVIADNEIVAFFSAWVSDNALDMFYIGFDYEKNNELQLYFNMLFFGLEQAIVLRREKLILGRTALDAKARMGCRPRYLNTFLLISNSLLRKQVLRLQKKASSGEGEWEQKHPFKQDS